jgi:hypothetical protein
MTEPSIEHLQAEIQDLRDLVVSLSVTLLRKVALDPHKPRRPTTNADAEQLLREADECFRCAKLPGLRREIAEGLHTAGHEFMAKAVALASSLQRTKSKK